MVICTCQPHVSNVLLVRKSMPAPSKLLQNGKCFAIGNYYHNNVVEVDYSKHGITSASLRITHHCQIIKRYNGDHGLEVCLRHQFVLQTAVTPTRNGFDTLSGDSFFFLTVMVAYVCAIHSHFKFDKVF